MTYCRCGHSRQYHEWRELFNGRRSLDACFHNACACRLFVEETSAQRFWRQLFGRRA